MRLEIVYASFVQFSLWTFSLLAWLLVTPNPLVPALVHAAVLVCAFSVAFTERPSRMQLAFMIGTIVSFVGWTLSTDDRRPWFVHIVAMLQACVAFRSFEPESRI